MEHTCALIAALTMQICDWKPTCEVVKQVYDVAIYAPKPSAKGWGHTKYVATAMCEAIDRWTPSTQICPRVNNVCLK